MNTKLHAISAAVLLAVAATAPAHAGLERFGPPNKAPTVGGFPAWAQDRTGVTLEFCDLTNQAEWDGGWCVLIQPDGPAGGLPEAFPDNFFDEHFYYAADNVLQDDARGFTARLVIALEAAFAVEKPIDGDQTVFSRHRLDIRPLPFDGDYRVITPFSDTTFLDQKAGDRIFETIDIGTGCPGTFECALNGTLGPFLLPSATAGGAEVPPLPDLQAAPAGTDPHYDRLVAEGGTTAAPGTGKKYLADPARVGSVTGSPLPEFTAYNTDGTTSQRNHNTFRIEVRPSSPDRNGAVFYTLDGETNFTLNGRLMAGNLPGRISGGRALYRADGTGNATDIDVFTTATPTVQARIPAQPRPAAVKPTLAFYPEPCAGAVTKDPVTGAITVNPGPYSAPAGTPVSLSSDEGSTDYWAQVALATAGAPPSHICLVDTSARNAAGQVEPAYMLRPVTDDVVIKAATYNGPQDGTLAVTAESSDPTAILTLAGFGTTPDATGVYTGRGPGAELTGNAVAVRSIKSPPNQVQVVSSRGGSGFHTVQTARGMAVTAGQASVSNVSGTISEDCSTTSAASCAAGQGVQVDLLANSTFRGQPLRAQVASGAVTVAVAVVQNARLGVASISADGILSYAPNANATGTDSVTFTVAVNGGAASDAASALITITPVNDAPVAGSTSLNAVQNITMSMNLLAGATDPDGLSDVKNAVITSWPVELGTQPVPVNGTISFAPATTGNFTIGYKVVDAAGAQSDNTGAASVNVAAGETISITRAQLETAKVRWRVDGTDTIRSSQTISVTFTNGTLARGPNAGKTCDGTGAIPECTIGTTGVTPTGTYSLDQTFSSDSFQNPAGAGGWAVAPTAVRVWSSNPVLGGDASRAFTRK